MKAKLTEQDFADAADALGCSVAAIKAVCAVEAPKGGFQDDGQPRILFERHYFSRLTMGVWDAKHPDISNRTPGGYGLESIQHDKLKRAAALERELALMSASWGKFQIMGANWKQCGFASLQAFINAMYAGEREQLQAFVGFIRADKTMHSALIGCDWKTFARRYNGPNYAINKYDTKLASEFLRAKVAA